MTARNLDAVFAPRSIALIGASNQPKSVGAVIAANLFGAGFRGPVMTVNPHESQIHSVVNYRSVGDLPIVPDLAVIATPPSTVPGLIAELAGRGCRAAVVVTAGFGEGGQSEGQTLRRRMLEAARPNLFRVIGPNSLGFISPVSGINASFAQLTPQKGGVALLTQSGAIATAMLDWAAARGIGFSHVVSLGDMADVDFGDMLDYLAADPSTDTILLYVEAITSARKFLSAGRIASRLKPVIVIKAGRSPAGARAALSHTGALAGSDAVYDAAFRRAGMLRVTELGEFYSAAATLATQLSVEGDRLAILTNGGGLGVVAADALERYGGQLADLSPASIARLNEVLPKTWSRSNPIDILGDASGKRYADALGCLAENGSQDAILVINCPTAIGAGLEAANAVVDFQTGAAAGQSVLTCWVGEGAAQEARRLFTAHRLPSYEAPDEAVRAFMHLVSHRRNQQLLIEAPAARPGTEPGRRERVQKIVAVATAAGRSVLSEPDSKAVLSAYGIPTVTTHIVADAAAASAVAAQMSFPVALKILSPDITHKSDVGGVRLDLATPEAVERAAREMLEAVGRKAPTAVLTGFTVQEMVQRAHAQELLAGIADDPTFGPVVLFGQGGTATEVIADRVIGLPPLNLVLAREMISRTRIARLLDGYRDHARADLGAIADVLVRLSDLVSECPEILELDINPLLADADGVIALDARIVVDASGHSRRFAILPYPTALEARDALPSGGYVDIRPIRPEDQTGLVDMLERSAPEDRRLRFLAAGQGLTRQEAARLTQIDYDREMALIALDAEGAVVGVARFIADPDRAKAEFAVMVRTDRKGQGIGYRLMTALLSHARATGVRVVQGDALLHNVTMLNMAHELGFQREATDDPAVVRLTLTLGG